MGWECVCLFVGLELSALLWTMQVWDCERRFLCALLLIGAP